MKENIPTLALLFAASTMFLTSCGGGGGESAGKKKSAIPFAQAKAGSTPSLRAARFKKLLKSHPKQNRPEMQEDPRLSKAARARARDMATRAYFSHTDPDGNGPHVYVKRAGYRLPNSYQSGRKANYVESILGGSGTAANALEQWMSSSAHKKHLLAESGFYKKQTRYGVGQVTVPGSPMLHYWVFISAPPES